ncbi:MAG: hypothetical protein LBM08_14615 [Dysgonamonadaceae bacterium]|jgi:hypothetical protein|nr:hypothetical protein [Dysgonamonadaceae bacterium]
MKQLQIKQIKALSFTDDWKIKAETMLKEAVQGSVDTVNWEAYPYRPEVKFYLAWTDASFFLLFDVHEDSIRAVNTGYHSPVYEDSCVEFFFQHVGADVYRNFEFNCIGTALSAIRESRTSFFHLPSKVMDKILIHTSLPQEPIIKDSPVHWQILVEIPLELLGFSQTDPTTTALRANFYKCGDKTLVPHFLSWNPIPTTQPDFHRPEYFGEIRFVRAES